MMIKKDKEIRAQGGATGGADGSTIETKEMPPIGSRVRRGPDWRWDNQDDNLPGTVVAHKSRGQSLGVRCLTLTLIIKISQKREHLKISRK